MALASFLQGQVWVTRIDEHHVAFSSIKIAGVLANAHGNPHQQSSHKITPGCGHHMKGCSHPNQITLIEASIDELDLLASRIGIAVYHLPENIWQALDLRM
jgi:hypothetical protein